jgi:hypothetical protein
MALSKQLRTESIESMGPESRALLVNADELNCDT